MLVCDSDKDCSLFWDKKAAGLIVDAAIETHFGTSTSFGEGDDSIVRSSLTPFFKNIYK